MSSLCQHMLHGIMVNGLPSYFIVRLQIGKAKVNLPLSLQIIFALGSLLHAQIHNLFFTYEDLTCTHHLYAYFFVQYICDYFVMS